MSNKAKAILFGLAWFGVFGAVSTAVTTLVIFDALGQLDLELTHKLALGVLALIPFTGILPAIRIYRERPMLRLAVGLAVIDLALAFACPLAVV